jgi:hypothetical protein
MINFKKLFLIVDVGALLLIVDKGELFFEERKVFLSLILGHYC